MRGKDLAGLAALGTLGYMLANRKKGADVDTSGVSDVDLTGGARSMTQDTGELRAEDGTMSKLRRNTETGDLYSPDEPITRPSASSVASVQKAVRNPAGVNSGVTRMSKEAGEAARAKFYESNKPDNTETDFAPSGIGSGKKSPKPDVSYQDKLAMEYLMKKKAEKEKPTKTSSLSRPNSYYDTDQMKRGGKVVKMAKGGMTASSRADGIAQRGKTRGTMVMCGGGYMKGKK